jgi:hypothetical protein
MVLAAVVALAAAATYALATALLHRSAELVDTATGRRAERRPDVAGTGRRDEGRPDRAGIGRFVAGNVRHPLWIVGMVTESVGFALHAVALHSGPITLVQPLLVTGLIFALPVRQLIERRRPDAVEIAWATLLAGGLAVFLLSATPGHGPAGAPDTVPTIVTVVVVGAGMLGAGVVGVRSSSKLAAPVLGFGAGLGFAAVAGLLKVVTTELGRHGLVALTEWPFWALFPSGLGGLLLNQLAFRVAPLRASLPTLSTVDPLASILIGVAVFDEPFAHAASSIAGEIVGLVLIVGPIIALTRRDPHRPETATLTD